MCGRNWIEETIQVPKANNRQGITGKKPNKHKTNNIVNIMKNKLFSALGILDFKIKTAAVCPLSISSVK